MGKDNNIPVLDINNQFLSYTNPAKARILTRKGKAKVFCRNPYMLQLLGEVGENEMSNIRSSSQHSRLILNFTKYFKEEREVYIQNLTDTQISMTFRGQGEEYHKIIPRTRKPYNLTQDVPFYLIKMSTDFRRIVNRNPPALRLLEEEEFVEYYEKQAERNGTSFDTEFGKALDIANRLQNKQELPSDRMQRENNQKLEERIEELEKPVELLPQIIGLCARASKDQGAQRVQAGDFLDDLEMLAPKMTLEDWEFVQTKGVYKTVKNYAAKQVDALTAEDEDDE